MKRLEIYWTELEKKGSIQGGLRPCLLVSNNLACQHSPTLIVVPITTAAKKQLPTHMNITNVLKSKSTILFEQLITVNKEQLINKITDMPTYYEEEVNEKIEISLGLCPAFA